jgi:hypothetical protein
MAVVDADHNVVIDGVDFDVLDAEGMIRSVTGSSELLTGQASWPEDEEWFIDGPTASGAAQWSAAVRRSYHPAEAKAGRAMRRRRQSARGRRPHRATGRGAAARR